MKDKKMQCQYSSAVFRKGVREVAEFIEAKSGGFHNLHDVEAVDE